MRLCAIFPAGDVPLARVARAQPVRALRGGVARFGHGSTPEERRAPKIAGALRHARRASQQRAAAHRRGRALGAPGLHWVSGLGLLRRGRGRWNAGCHAHGVSPQSADAATCSGLPVPPVPLPGRPGRVAPGAEPPALDVAAPVSSVRPMRGARPSDGPPVSRDPPSVAPAAVLNAGSVLRPIEHIGAIVGPGLWATGTGRYMPA